MVRSLLSAAMSSWPPDALAFEERNWSAIGGQAEDYELASRLIRGQTLLGKVLHDVRVALDYLATRGSADCAEGLGPLPTISASRVKSGGPQDRVHS
jgi:hypothetical protein